MVKTEKKFKNPENPENPEKNPKKTGNRKNFRKMNSSYIF